MQRYRVNLPLLIGLLVGSVAVAGAVGGLYVYQAARNTEGLLKQAEEAKAEGDLRGERNFLSQYYRKRPGDVEVARRLADVAIEVSKLKDAETSDVFGLSGFLERLVRDFPDDLGLRRKLVDTLVASGRVKAAEDHVNYLLLSEPKNGELQELRLLALVQAGKNVQAEKAGYALIGYSSQTDSFDAEKAVTPAHTGIYTLVAQSIRRRDGDPEHADRLVDYMVEANPDLSEAYFARGQYRLGNRDFEEGEADIDKALELDAKNVDALLSKAQLVITNASKEDEEGEERTDAEKTADIEAAYESAKELLARASEADSSDWRVYRLLARLERQRGDYEASIAQYDDGIAKVSENARIQLRFDKARAQLDASRDDDAEKTIAEFSDVGAATVFSDYLTARLNAVRGNWVKAADEFERISTMLSQRVDLAVELNIHLGDCYEKLGQTERARNAYQTAEQIDPSNRFVRVKVKQLDSKLSTPKSRGSEFSIGRVIADEQRKPADQQDWDAVLEQTEAYADAMDLAPGMVNLIKAEVFVRRGMPEEAKEMVKAAVTENGDNINVWRSALRVIASNPEQGPVTALGRMEKVVERFGDLPILRLDKADFLMAIGDEDLKSQLMAIDSGTESWSKKDRVQIWRGLADRFGQLRDREAQQTYLSKIVDLSPNQLPALLQLFQTALEQDEPDRVNELQAKIADLVGSKEKPTYQYTEATKILWKFQRGSATDEDLANAERLVERAELERGDWHELHLLKARLFLAKGDKSAALASFDEALKKGPVNAFALLQHVGLLLERGRYVDASKVLESVDAQVRQRLLGRNYAEILLNTGAIVEAVASADQVLEKAAGNGATHLWYGRFCSRLTRSPKLSKEQQADVAAKTDAALSRAVELTPESGEAWLTRIQFLIDQRRNADAEQQLRLAQLALSEDQVAAVMANSYEWLGRWFDAERAYSRLRESQPERLRIARQMAAFYLSRRYPKDDRTQKATPLINSILQAAADDPKIAENAVNDADIRWARRKAAELLAGTRDYQKLLDAEKLIRTNVTNGALGEDDKLLMARILASRPEPISRRKAIRLFTEVQRNRILPISDDLRLGQLYQLTEQWDAARRQMFETIARNPRVPLVRQQFINMLLAEGGASNLEEAQKQLTRMQESGAPREMVLRLVVRVAAKRGQKKQAIAAIRALVPKNLASANAQQLLMVAGLMTELGDLDTAEKLYRTVASKVPDAQIYLSDFLAAHRDIEQALNILDGMFERGKFQSAIRGGLLAVRAQRSEYGDAFDDRVDKWLAKAIREEPDSIPFQLQLAEFRDLQKRYDEAAVVYKKLLERNDLEGTQRAIVLNNLGYLLALKSDSRKAAEEAMGYVAEAIDILGPQADILDTRAVVYTSLKDYQAATTDLELSLTDNPTASKYFHKARAHMLAGETAKAVDAWNNAIELGLTRDGVATAEQGQFDELEQKMGRVTQSAAR